MGNCYSHKVTFQLYAFNQVIKRLEIQLCWKKYWLYLHKPPSSAFLDLLSLSTLITERAGKSLPVAHGMESSVPMWGLWRGASATLSSPKARQTSPGKPAQSPSSRFVSFLHIGPGARHIRGGALWPRGLPGLGHAASQQRAGSHLYCGFVCSLLQPGSELDNLEEILDDLQNSQLPQLFPDSRPGVPAGSVDKQAIINDLMQLTSDSSPGAAVATQKPAMRISQSSECSPSSQAYTELGKPQCGPWCPGEGGRSRAARSPGRSVVPERHLRPCRLQTRRSCV